tara:strand:+ start:668 stop:823 length:156 start_codon:yes stop_codon:yes gene_type:complete
LAKEKIQTAIHHENEAQTLEKITNKKTSEAGPYQCKKAELNERWWVQCPPP